MVRFIGQWQQKVLIERFVFEPPENHDGPLSWHLTPRQVEELKQMWEQNTTNEDQAEKLRHFVEGTSRDWTPAHPNESPGA